MKMTIPALMQWIALGEKVLDAGKGPLNAVIAAAAAHGVEQDTAQLNAVIVDGERRKAIAAAEASGGQ